MPPRRDVRAAAPGFREHLFAYQQPKFDAYTGKPNALPAHFGAGGDVVIPPHGLSLHTRSIIRDGERSLCGISRHHDSGGARVQRIGDDFGEDGFFKGRWIRIPQVFQ